MYRYIGSEALVGTLGTHSYNDTALFERINVIQDPAEVRAYLSNSSVDAVGELIQTATSTAVIEAVVGAGSVAVAAGTAGVGATGAA